MSNRLQLTLVATLFNVLFEYALRGINAFLARPFFIVIMFTAYFTLFTLQDGLIRRYHLRDYHLFILAFTYGMVYQCLFSGVAFQEPTFLGINWGQVLFTLIFWWGTVQSVLTFYIANRVVARDWSARAVVAWRLGDRPAAESVRNLSLPAQSRNPPWPPHWLPDDAARLRRGRVCPLPDRAWPETGSPPL